MSPLLLSAPRYPSQIESHARDTRSSSAQGRPLQRPCRDGLADGCARLRALTPPQPRELVRCVELGAMFGIVISLSLFCVAVLGMVFWAAPLALKNTLLVASIGVPLPLSTAVGAVVGALREWNGGQPILGR